MCNLSEIKSGDSIFIDGEEFIALSDGEVHGTVGVTGIMRKSDYEKMIASQRQVIGYKDSNSNCDVLYDSATKADGAI